MIGWHRLRGDGLFGFGEVLWSWQLKMMARVGGKRGAQNVTARRSWKRCTISDDWKADGLEYNVMECSETGDNLTVLGKGLRKASLPPFNCEAA